MNNENPHVIPGRYNPQAQAKTEVGDYVNSIYPGYIDPTQIPMNPGDTQIPMYRDEPVVNNSPIPRSPLGLPRPLSLPQESQVSNQQNVSEVIINSNQQIQAIKIPIVIELTINLNIKHNG